MPLTRPPLLFRLTLIAALLPLPILGTGCQIPESPAPEDHGHDLPEHRSDDFPHAVRRLRSLDAEIRSAVADGRIVESNAELLAILIDIAGWLPELAAESDMPEAPWNRVNTLSNKLVSQYQDVQGTQLSEVEPMLSELERIVEESDPAWFDRGYRRGQAIENPPDEAEHEGVTDE